MLSEKDLEAAVKAGDITAEQAAKLRRQATSTTVGSAAPASNRNAETETPKIARGFNDVMLALGTAIITLALMSQWYGSGKGTPTALLATFPVLWGISELLNVRHRAVLPGIVAVIGLSLASAYIGGRYGYAVDATRTTYDGTLGSLVNFPARVTFWAAAAVAAINALYYARFRLPFALLPLALGIGIAAVQALILVFGLEQTAAMPHILGLFFGVLLFVAAMAFDTSDPRRLTRRADCGFWLHLAAAPLMVHSLISIFGGAAIARTGAGSALTGALIAGFTIVALIIDRRALIVSSLSYLLAAVGYVVSTASALLGGSLFATLIVLGAIVLLVGMGWHAARRLILAPFRGQSWLNKLPPIEA